MTTPWWRKPFDRVTVLLGATIVIALVGQFATPERAAPPTTIVVPISELALTCPALPADTPGYSLALKAALRGGAKEARIGLQAAREAVARVKPGAIRAIPVKRSSAALVTASGTSASQLVADASLVGTTTGTRGYATYACQPPSASQWLVGGSAVAGRSATLTIANVDDIAATVNLEVWTEQGKSGARSLEGIAIPARSRTLLPLTLIEPGRSIYAVHVIATAGQVSAAIVDRGQAALTSLGIDVIAGAPEPALSQIVGIIPAGSRAARIAFVSPDVATTVRISLITDDGEFALAGSEALAVDADVLNVVEIPEDALVGDLAVRLRSDDPVLAGSSYVLNLRGGADLASSPVMAPIYRAATFTIDGGVSKATALLRSERTTQVVVVTGIGPDQKRTTVTVSANKIVAVPLVNKSGQARLIAIEPEQDGIVSGSVLLQRASQGMVATSVQPLLSIRGFVAVPPVAPASSR